MVSMDHMKFPEEFLYSVQNSCISQSWELVGRKLEKNGELSNWYQEKPSVKEMNNKEMDKNDF